MIISHVGNNVGVIHDMTWEYPKVEAVINKKFEKELKNIKYKYLVATTANKYQADCAKTLEENGFRAVVEFKSSHESPSETVTLWAKTQSQVEDLSKTYINWPEENCTVTYNREINKYCCVTVKTDKDTDESLKKDKFKRIKNTPIYFRVREDKIIKKEKKGEKE